MKNVSHPAQGILMMGPYGRHSNAVWLFVNGDEAALIEMPDYRNGREARPWFAARRLLKKIGAKAKYALMTHAHFDHCHSLLSFRQAFPDTEFLAHQSQARSRLLQRMTYGEGPIFDEVFSQEIQILNLNGEPLILIHAPKHSQSDVLMFYRGTALTGDWYLGDLKDCNALVDPTDKIQSIERVQYWLARLNYRVTRAYSGHGDCLMEDIDFMALLEQSKTDHSRALALSP